MTARAPADVWLAHLGEMLDEAAVCTLLGRDSEPVSRSLLRERGDLLALPVGSGDVVYPAAQFRDRVPAPALDRVLALLPPDVVSPWTVASWLVSPEAELAGQRPMDVLLDGPDRGRTSVVDIACRWTEQLAG